MIQIQGTDKKVIYDFLVSVSYDYLILSVQGNSLTLYLVRTDIIFKLSIAIEFEEESFHVVLDKHKLSNKDLIAETMDFIKEFKSYLKLKTSSMYISFDRAKGEVIFTFTKKNKEPYTHTHQVYKNNVDVLTIVEIINTYHYQFIRELDLVPKDKYKSIADALEKQKNVEFSPIKLGDQVYVPHQSILTFLSLLGKKNTEEYHIDILRSCRYVLLGTGSIMCFIPRAFPYKPVVKKVVNKDEE